MTNHHQVTRFLTNLNNEQLIGLGTHLGLLHPHLQRMTDLPGDMVASWLRKEDHVTETSGAPSWGSLTNALEAIGQRGIASEIREGRSSCYTM